MAKRPSSRVMRVFSRVIVALPLVAALAFVIVVRFFPDTIRPTGADAVSIVAGNPVPPVRVAGADGVVVPLPRLLGAGNAIVTLMSPDCTHCHTELQTLAKLVASPGSLRAPQVVVVSVGDASRTGELRAKYPRMAIYDDVDGTFSARYGLRSVPVLLFTDESKTVRAVRGGYISEKLIRGLLEDLPGA